MKPLSLTTLGLTLFLTSVASVALASAPSSATESSNPETELCETRGDNPCCLWEEDNDCTILDSQRKECNEPPSEGETWGTGAYSEACASYLEACSPSKSAWMTTAIEAMRDFVSQNTDLVPASMSSDEVNAKADAILTDPWRSFDTEHGKCMSVGFATGTYLGIYNCDSAFEKTIGDETGCLFFGDAYEADKYVGTVRNVAPCSGETGTSCPSSIDRFAEDECCAFNLFPYDQRGDADDFVYAFNTKNVLEVTSRPWFTAAENDAAKGAEPVWLDPYQNYTTGHPVFGWSQGVFDDQGEILAVALVLEYIADDPAYLDFDAQCLASSGAKRTADAPN